MGQTDPGAFGDLLRRYRAAASVTQEELAERAGLSVRGISDLERGARRHPHRDTVQMLANALALSPRAVFGVAEPVVTGFSLSQQGKETVQ